MSFLIKKEIRLLLPAWVVAMVLAIFAPPIPGSWLLGYSDTPLGLFLGLLLLGIASFGQEFSSGSFSALLSHPMERSRIWNAKTSMLAYAFILVFAAWVVHKVFIKEVFLPYSEVPPRFFPNALGVDPFILDRNLMLALAIFTGSLWTTLLLRQIVAAFGLTLLVPLATMFWIGIIANHYNWSVRTCDHVVDGVLAAYSIAGFLWARWLFLHAQDTQWTGGNFSFPWRADISGQKLALISKPPRHWLGALAWKEILLHQANLLIAALILALHLSSVFIRKVHPHFRDPDVQFILDSIWVLWLLMPLLVGSAAVAEERKLGVIESQLCLPVSRRLQLFVKFFAGLGLSLFFGAAIPSAIESLGLYTIPVLGLAALIFLISFYSSSLARTTLQAIGLAMLIFTLLYFYESGMTIHLFSYGQTYSSAQIGLIYLARSLSLPVLLLVSASLASWNFKWLHQNRKLWARNIIVLLISLAFISVSARSVYFRAWELFTPVESPHGPARLTVSDLPALSSSFYGIAALWPDGRLWTADTRSSYTDSHGTRHHFSRRQKFLDGSNWVSAASSDYSLSAIKSDGTLWNFRFDPPDRLAQIGSDTNWLKVAGAYWPSGFLLLKKDGTVWYWGRGGDDLTNFSEPIRASEGTNYTNVVESADGPGALKNDGSFWTIGFGFRNPAPHLVQTVEPPDVGQKIQVPFGFVELSTNGDLLYSTGDFRGTRDVRNPFETRPFGQNMKWKAAATGQAAHALVPYYSSLFTIRSDGTLWEWMWQPMGISPERWTQEVQPVQLGNNSDWITLLKSPSYQNQPAYALAADGSLWAWDQPSDTIWLAPSRRPAYMGNIFEATP